MIESVGRVLTRTQQSPHHPFCSDLMDREMEASHIWFPVRRCLPSLVTMIAISRTALNLEQLPRTPHHVCRKAEPRLEMVRGGVLA